MAFTAEAAVPPIFFKIAKNNQRSARFQQDGIALCNPVTLAGRMVRLTAHRQEFLCNTDIDQDQASDCSPAKEFNAQTLLTAVLSLCASRGQCQPVPLAGREHFSQKQRP